MCIKMLENYKIYANEVIKLDLLSISNSVHSILIKNLICMTIRQPWKYVVAYEINGKVLGNAKITQYLLLCLVESARREESHMKKRL